MHTRLGLAVTVPASFFCLPCQQRHATSVSRYVQNRVNSDLTKMGRAIADALGLA